MGYKVYVMAFVYGLLGFVAAVCFAKVYEGFMWKEGFCLVRESLLRFGKELTGGCMKVS